MAGPPVGDGGATTFLKAIPDDALVETAFRRLVSSFESEKDRLRQTATKVDQEREYATAEVTQIRQANDDWCYDKNQKIEAEWKRLDKLNDRLSTFWPVDAKPPIEIKCSGKVFVLSQQVLCSIKGSALAEMFSDDFIHRIPTDPEGKYVLDFNPVCFSYVVDYLMNRRLRPDAPTPIIPREQQQSMEMLAEELRLTPFLRVNAVSAFHNTSLAVVGNTITATHPAWQVAPAIHPLSSIRTTHFSVKILSNPDPKGALGIGICGHIPKAQEVHSIHLTNSAMYVSDSGLVGDLPSKEDISNAKKEPQPLIAGSVLVVGYNPQQKVISWYLNGNLIATATIPPEQVDKYRTVYPVFALYIPDQKIQVVFDKERVDAALEAGYLMKAIAN
jgi:hypothetical protein